jgi:glucose-6-phosphate-specific signal transduction histidine kinase
MEYKANRFYDLQEKRRAQIAERVVVKEPIEFKKFLPSAPLLLWVLLSYSFFRVVLFFSIRRATQLKEFAVFVIFLSIVMVVYKKAYGIKVMW